MRAKKLYSLEFKMRRIVKGINEKSRAVILKKEEVKVISNSAKETALNFSDVFKFRSFGKEWYCKIKHDQGIAL